MLATEAELATGFYGVIKQFGWRKVAFIEQNENLFTEVSSCGAVWSLLLQCIALVIIMLLS